MKIWIITDTHFGHIKLQDVLYVRPPGFSRYILDAIKKNVEPGDVLIHLGDFCIGSDLYWMAEYYKATKGVTNILVRGNHDSKSTSWYMTHGFHFVCDAFIGTYFGKSILFSHKPLTNTGRADINIHGHLHGNSHRIDESFDFYDPAFHKQLALEVDGYGPISLETFMKGNKFNTLKEGFKMGSYSHVVGNLPVKIFSDLKPLPRQVDAHGNPIKRKSFPWIWMICCAAIVIFLTALINVPIFRECRDHGFSINYCFWQGK